MEKVARIKSELEQLFASTKDNDPRINYLNSVWCNFPVADDAVNWRDSLAEIIDTKEYARMPFLTEINEEFLEVFTTDMIFRVAEYKMALDGLAEYLYNLSIESLG